MVETNKNDELKISSDKMITKHFEPDEVILLSTKITKCNDKKKKKRWDRVLLITSKNIYNIKPKSEIRRKIPTNLLKAVTESGMSNEFVIHIPDEYDYRYSHITNRDKIIEALDQVYRSRNGGEKIPVFKMDSINLQKYTTTKEDKKAGISRIPGVIEEKKDKVIEATSKDEGDTNTGMIYAKEKGKDVCLNDFALLKELGKGGFGKVTLVRKKDTGELFAIKSLKKADIFEKGQLEHTRTERMVLEQLRHPFLVSLEYCFQTQEKIYFVMQYMRGGELFHHLRNDKKFSEKRAKFYVAQIAMALGHLHSKNIIHRDMKPENVLMDENGYVSLADFGMAKVIQAGTAAISFVGTREYLAPEIITEEGHGKEADWWGLGIFAYELMFGGPPFQDANDHIMYEMIKKDKVPFKSQSIISAEARDFIEKCLIKNQKERLGSQNDFEEVKSHPWFQDYDWVALANKQIAPDFKPKLESETTTGLINRESAQERSINMLSSSQTFKPLLQNKSLPLNKKSK